MESSGALLQNCVRISRNIMKAFVTGASGFIGSNLVHELVAQGHRVKALLRPNSDERGLAGVEFERVTGDVLDRKLLEREMEGCDWCFHVAASYHLWLRDYTPMYAANVDGTRNVLEAAGKAGCQRIVYTSTVGCIGLPKMVDGRLVPSTELDAISERATDESLQTLKMAGGMSGRETRAQRAAHRHRQSHRARRPARRETDADRPGDCGFSESQIAGVSRHRIELGSRPRRGRSGTFLRRKRGRLANATFWATKRATGRCGKPWPCWRKSPACPRRK